MPSSMPAVAMSLVPFIFLIAVVALLVRRRAANTGLRRDRYAEIRAELRSFVGNRPPAPSYGATALGLAM